MAAIMRPRGAGGGRPRAPRYKRKTKRVRLSRQGRVIAKWQHDGWELEREAPFKRRIDLTFRKQKPQRRWSPWAETFCVVAIVVAALVVAIIQPPDHLDPYAKVRREAAAAIKELRADNLSALEKDLAAHRGQTDFAYYFTSATGPRTLGDALASVAGTGSSAPFKAGVDTNAYDLELTDLAGTLALATHGTGARALPTSWTTDFAEATTTPDKLYRADADASGADSKRRADQDTANSHNLLLLLSRGYWSVDFLKAVTSAYWTFDHDNDDNGWKSDTLADAKYAPSPNGKYLSDGIVALTAALTTNPTADAWAFTGFQPGTHAVTYVDGSLHDVGAFTHFLFFEHRFPHGTDTDSVGMTAATMALSAAVDVTDPSGLAETSPPTGSPRADALVLQELAQAAAEPHKSFISKVWHRVEHATQAAWHWVVDAVARWGHPVLTALSLVPTPWVKIPAGLVNAAWYAVDSDWADAGLSLAVILPGSAGVAAAVIKGARALKVGVEGTKAARAAAALARVAKEWRPLKKAWESCSLLRKPGELRVGFPTQWSRKQVRAATKKIEALNAAALSGTLKKSTAERISTTSASARLRAAGVEVRSDQDGDHTIDLQLGGPDDVSNLKPLDIAVNRSLGRQVALELGPLGIGTVVTAITVCR